MTRRKLAVLALSVLTGCAIGQAIAPPAHADESTFLETVADVGLPVTTTTLALGHQVCEDIITNGVAGVDTEARMGLSTGMTGTDVGHFIGAAVYNLCPSGVPAMQTWVASHHTLES